MRRACPAEEVEQQLPWGSGNTRSRFPPAGPDGIRGPGPLKLKARAAQPPGEKPGRAADVAPQGLVHGLTERPGTTAVGPADVLVVDEELIQAGDPPHPAKAEESSGLPGRNRERTEDHGQVIDGLPERDTW